MQLPRLRHIIRRLRRTEQKSASLGFVLAYHRVAEVEHDPWELCVSPERFAEHLEVLRTQRRPVVPSSSVARGEAPKNAVAITFDDGYLDNLVSAAPALERAGMPATFFITTGCIGQKREFWWDELEKVLLGEPTLPPVLELAIGGCDLSWATDGLDSSGRSALYFAVWEALIKLPEDERTRVLDQLLKWSAASPSVRESHRTLCDVGLRQLASHDLVQIGAHTVSHPVLPNLSPALQRQEIAQSKNRLEEMINCRPVTEISYPHGRHDAITRAMARDAGLSCGYTTQASPVSTADDPFSVPRVCIGNWTGDEFAWHLRRNFNS